MSAATDELGTLTTGPVESANNTIWRWCW